MIKIILLRSYYGANIHGDMAGDFGVTEYMTHVLPDMSFVNAASLLPAEEAFVLDANALKYLPSEVLDLLPDNYNVLVLKTSAPTIKLDIEFARVISRRYPSMRVVLTGRVSLFLKDWIKTNVPEKLEIADVSTEDYIHFLLTRRADHLQLNDLPRPDYSKLPYQKYRMIDNTAQASLFSSRGCVVNCNYCPYSAQHSACYEERSIEKLGDDIEGILALGIQKIQFRDQYFTAYKDRTKAICRMIKDRNLKFQWVCETKIDNLDEEILEIMVDAGLDTICFGIETASEKVHEEYGRPVSSLEKLKKMIDFIASHNTKTIGFYMVGFPKESFEDLNKTFKLAQALSTNYATFHIWTPYLGTKTGNDFFKNLKISPDLFPLFKNRMQSGNNDLKEMKFKFTENLAEYFFTRYVEEKEGLEKFYKHSFYKINAKKSQVEGFRRSLECFGSMLEDYKVIRNNFQELL